jgi:hypothetical protein
VPHIAVAFPAGGQRGTTVSVLLRGEQLDQVSSVHFSGSGVDAKIVEAAEGAVKLTVQIAPDASLGARDLRVIRPTGLSNRARFFVGQLPEIAADRPRAKDYVQPLPSLPVLVNGYVLPSETHAYSFAAKAGQQIVCQVQAQEAIPLIADAVPGWPQMVLTLYDPGGKELAYVDDFRFHPDPVLIQKIPRDGQYRLEIRDAVYRGREDFIYRLSVGVLPYLTDVFPLGGPEGKAATVALAGANLPSNSCAVNAPESPAAVPVTVKGDLQSNALQYDVGQLPEVTVSGASTQPSVLSAPVIANGRLEQPGQEQVFTFHAEAKQELVFEVLARRLGSPLDSLVRVTDAKGTVLGQNDDFIDERCPLVTHQADSRLSVRFARAGDYQLHLSDAQGHGGPEYAYRLVISPPRPDFALLVLPDNPRIAAGDRAIVTVHAIRRDGFDGEIHVSASNLPPGFGGDATIGAKETDARLMISAPGDLKPGRLLQPTIEGRATIGGRDVVRHATPAEQLMQAFSFVYRVPTEELLMFATEPPPFVLTVDAAAGPVLDVQQGGEVKFVVKVRRNEAAAGQIGVSLDPSSSRGVSLKWTPIPPDKDQVEVTMTVAPKAPVGRVVYPIIAGTARKDGLPVVKYAPAPAVKILPAPATQPATQSATAPTSRPATQPVSAPVGK